MREKSQCVSISGPRISGQEILHYANIYYRYGICGSGEFLLTGNIMSTSQVCMGLTTRNCKRLFPLSDSNKPYIYHGKTFMQQQTWGRRFTQRADHLTHAHGRTHARTAILPPHNTTVGTNFYRRDRGLCWLIRTSMWTLKLTSKSLQFLSVIAELLAVQGAVSSIGMEILYVPNGLWHSSAPSSTSSHGELLRKWQHIGSKRVSSFFIQNNESPEMWLSLDASTRDVVWLSFADWFSWKILKLL